MEKILNAKKELAKAIFEHVMIASDTETLRAFIDYVDGKTYEQIAEDTLDLAYLLKKFWHDFE